MSGIFGSDPPQPPDPVQVAGAQTATNVSTAIANANLNNVNQVTPLGNLSYDQTSTYTFTDPSDGKVYNIPRFTATQTLSKSQQDIQDASQGAQINLANLAKNQSGTLKDLLGTDFSQSAGYKATPTAGDTSRISNVAGPQSTFADTGAQQSSLGDYGQQQSTFGAAGDITKDYGPADNFSADRNRVEESLFSRLNPQLKQDDERLRQQLADQGLRYGSTAYEDAYRTQNDKVAAQRAAITQVGGVEQQRLNDMTAQRAGFQNAAQKQAYEQAQGRGQFANAAQAQQFQETLGAGQFKNLAQQNAFTQAATRGQFANAAQAQTLAQQQAIVNAQNADRSRHLTEQYALRQEPINEVTALLSGSQVKQPSFTQTPSNQIPTTDIAGLLNNNFTQNLDSYKQQSSNTNALLGGILGLGGNLAKLSDRRAKKDVHKMATVFAANPDGDSRELPIYRYAYKDDPASVQHVGPMAQDVEKIDPAMIGERKNRKYIKNPQHVMGSILRAS